MLRLLSWRSHPYDCLVELGYVVKIIEPAAVVRSPEEFKRESESPRTRPGQVSKTLRLGRSHDILNEDAVCCLGYVTPSPSVGVVLVSPCAARWRLTPVDARQRAHGRHQTTRARENRPQLQQRERNSPDQPQEGREDSCIRHIEPAAPSSDLVPKCIRSCAKPPKEEFARRGNLPDSMNFRVVDRGNGLILASSDECCDKSSDDRDACQHERPHQRWRFCGPEGGQYRRVGRNDERTHHEGGTHYFVEFFGSRLEHVVFAFGQEKFVIRPV